MLVVVMASCKVGAGSDPKSTAIAFIEAMKNKDFDAAEKYATKDTKTFLDLVKMAASMANMDNKNHDMDFDQLFNLKNASYGDAKINGDNATVSLMVNGKEQMPINLNKEDGAWKVAFDMNTLMKQATEKFGGNHNSINMDSVMSSINNIQDSSKTNGYLKQITDSLK